MDTNPDALSSLLKISGQILRHCNAATDIGSKLKEFSHYSEREGRDYDALVTNLINEIKNIKDANLTSKEQLIDMREAALEQQAARDKFSRYELWETPEQNFVYRFKVENPETEKVHYICPNCKENGKVHILQGDQTSKRCMVCEQAFRFDKSNGVRIARTSPTDFWGM